VSFEINTKNVSRGRGKELKIISLEGVPPSIDRESSAMRTGASQGLAPRFETLPQFGKSPNSPCGVTAKAVTPPPQRMILCQSKANVLVKCYVFLRSNI